MRRKNMLKRMLLMLLAMALFLGAIGFFKFRQVQEAIAQGSSFQPPPEAVTTVIAPREDWEEVIEAIGTVTAVNGVMVSADLPGIVETIAFESGRKVAAGDLLVRLDTRQEKAQLAAAMAQRDLARLNFDRAQGLRAEGVMSQADYDAAKAALDQAEASVGEIRATIDRKTIRAPFAGVLGIRQVHLGQYLSGGTAVVPLQSLDPIHVDFAVPQQDLARVTVGGTVRITTDSLPGEVVQGKVTAIDAIIDTATRNVQVQATLANEGHRLRPGMFVRAKVVLPQTTSVVALPASAILYAPYGDSVYIVEKMKRPDGAEYLGVRQQVVRLGAGRGDQIAVLSGVKPGEEVVTSGVFKLRNGAAVVVNNETRPANSPAPTPQES
jgi:membrane fusion protein (multidrug efflux system)